ncbi:TetR/AcrR family transcriptional regulator C-terminal domain-containing protein [Kocuria sp. CPCC 205263]
MEVAVAILDESGIEGLTMRSLAQRLEVTATALYWHVSSKEDVLDLAFDHVFGEVRVPEPGPDFTQEVEELLLSWRAAMLRHPWSPTLIGRPVQGPNVVARTACLQAALVRGGLADHGLTVATHLLANYVIGACLTEATWHQHHDPDLPARAQAPLAVNAQLYPTFTDQEHLEDHDSEKELFLAGARTILGALRHGPVTG